MQTEHEILPSGSLDWRECSSYITVLKLQMLVCICKKYKAGNWGFMCCVWRQVNLYSVCCYDVAS